MTSHELNSKNNDLALLLKTVLIGDPFRQFYFSKNPEFRNCKTSDKSHHLLGL